MHAVITIAFQTTAYPLRSYDGARGSGLLFELASAAVNPAWIAFIKLHRNLLLLGLCVLLVLDDLIRAK